MGLITKITYPDDETIEYSYDPNGHVLDRTDQRGWVTEYEYDKSGHMLEKYCTVNNITTECSFTYDGLGRMLTAEKEIDSNAVSYSEFTYSDLGYLAQTEQKIGNGSEYIIEYERDQGGLTSQITYPDPNMDGMVLDIAYTPLGKIASIKRDNDTLAQYTYLGQNVLRRFYQDPCVTLTASFDDFGRTSRLYSHTDTTNIADFLYSYDDNGNITEQLFAHRTSDPCNLYAYDNLDRLTEADYLVGVLTEDEQFTYDKLGNRTTVNLRDGNDETYARNDLTNRYDATGSYDITLDYDDAGNTTEDANDYTYEYDYENRLIKVLDPNDNTIVEYSYDALGRRIEKVAGGVTTRYYYDGWRILSEIEGNTSRNFVYGNYLDEVLIMIVDDGQNQADHYYTHDHLYSPVALIADDGTVEERYEYDAYGKCTIWVANFTNTRNTSSYNNHIFYTGQRYDFLENGDLPIGNYKCRSYLPTIGRFLQHDQFGVIPNSYLVNSFMPLNQYYDGVLLYAYGGNNPLLLLDPYGYWRWKEVVRAGIQLVGGCLSISAGVATSALPIPGARVLAYTMIAFGANTAVTGLTNIGRAMSDLPPAQDPIRWTASSTVSLVTDGNETAVNTTIVVIDALEISTAVANITMIAKQSIEIVSKSEEVISKSLKYYEITSKGETIVHSTAKVRHICGFKRAAQVTGIASGVAVDVYNSRDAFQSIIENFNNSTNIVSEHTEQVTIIETNNEK